MRIQYDPEVDALYIELLPLAPGTAENRELTEDIIADYSPDGRLAGLEIIDASQVLGEQLKEIIIEDASIGVIHQLALLMKWDFRRQEGQVLLFLKHLFPKISPLPISPASVDFLLRQSTRLAQNLSVLVRLIHSAMSPVLRLFDIEQKQLRGFSRQTHRYPPPKLSNHLKLSELVRVKRQNGSHCSAHPRNPSRLWLYDLA